jgi:O-antigen ligase
MPRRAQLAILIAFACHGLFILTARYRLSYDAYTHMLFANHYAENWFSLWEPRWYTGFTVVSYPPLTHQLIALFIPLLGFDRAFALVLWAVASLYPAGIYAFSRIFTGRSSASYAALASAVLMPIYVTAHIFGQLPFLTSTLTALFAAASLHRFLREGGIHNFALSVALIATSMAMHHATLMVQPFLLLAVTVSRLFQQGTRPRGVSTLFKRLVPFGAASLLAGYLVIFPFWQWGANQTLQTPIDHLSRHNFLADPLALAIFFFPLYGPLAAVIPLLFRKWHPRLIGLLISFALLFLLGLGGTTPLPRLFFGNAWEWLTYDRFAFWACLTLTPFFGTLFLQMKFRWKNRFASKPIPAALPKHLPSALTFSLLTLTSLGVWFTPLWFPTQPPPLDKQPIVNFLEADDHSQWRYLTFGFGDQFAYLNLLTTATTIDGSYHTARTLPELRASGIGQIDTVYWAQKGIPAIRPILKKSGEYGVRWGFVNRAEFIPELERDGWEYRETLSNGIQVWVNPEATPPQPSVPPEAPPVLSFAWGVFPLFTFVFAAALGALRLQQAQAEAAIRRIYAFLIGLMPLSFGLWAYRTVGEFSHPRVYFTYDHAFFFLSDALAALAVLLWLAVRVSRLPREGLPAFPRPCFLKVFFAIALLATVSLFWSRDWRTSLYISLHLWLVFLLILSLREWREAWTIALYGFCTALTFQLIAGFAGFALQSTAFLDPLNLRWPGTLDAFTRGASVVEAAGGLRLLRAYGTMPHPNFLGGFLVLALAGPAGLFLNGRKLNYPALLLLVLATILLGLTFSRSAWLAVFALVMVLLLKSRHFERRNLLLLSCLILLTFMLTLVPLRGFVSSRVSGSTVSTEAISSVGREWLAGQAAAVFLRQPLTGAGIGSFLLELAKTAPEGAPIEPVHNLFLLTGAELGAVGLILMAGMFLSIGSGIVRARSASAIVAGAVLAGLGVVSLFDHYLWTLAPGRMMLGLALGLWAGQAADEA